MIVEDRRTEQQQGNLRCLVVGTDTFMSGWGPCTGGLSYAAWACAEENLEDLLRWCRNRGDLQQVRVVRETPGKPYRPMRGRCLHLSIYPVEAGHVALEPDLEAPE